MIIAKIIAHNLFTYKDIELNLKDLVGLNLIMGINNDRSGASSNGAGKTNILEVILWIMFGITIKYGDSANKHMRLERKGTKEKRCSECYGKITINDPDSNVVYRIERYQGNEEHGDNVYFFVNDAELKDVEISKRLKSHTQRDINRTLGTDFKSFLNTNIFAADTVVAFASAKEGERNEVVDRILGLDILAQCHKETKERKREIDSSISLETNSIEMLDEQHDDLVEEIEEAEKKLKGEKAEIKSNLDEVSANKKKKEEDVKEVQSDIAIKETLKRKLETEKEKEEEEYESSVKLIEGKKKVLEKEISSFDTQIEVINVSINKIQKSIKSYSDLVDKKCPTCGSDITKDKVDKLVKNLDKEQTSASADRIALTVKLSDKKKEIKKLEDQIDAIDTSKIDKAEEKVEKVEQEISSLDGDKRVIENEIKNLTNEIQRLNEQKPVYADIIKDLKSKKEKNRKDVEDHKGKLQLLNDKQVLLQFWEEGYGSAGLKKYIIEDVKPQLNRLANQYSEDLTDGSIQIKFDLQSKERAGVVREKIDIQAINQFGADIYDGNSSGERTRIDIAILKALQKVSINRRFTQDWFDEVTSHLDDFGGERFIKMLRREISEGLVHSTFVISHLPAMKNNYDSIVTCTKTNGISTVSVT